MITYEIEKKIQHDAGISTSESGNGKSKKWLLIPVILIILVAGGAIYAGKAWNSVFHNVEASQNVSSDMPYLFVKSSVALNLS